MATLEVSKNGNTLVDLRFANLYQFGFWHPPSRLFFTTACLFSVVLLYWFIQYVFDSFRKSYLSKAWVEILVDLSCINLIFGTNLRVIALFFGRISRTYVDLFNIFSPMIKHILYGATSCGVFKLGIQNYKDFCLRVNIPKGNNWILSFEFWLKNRASFL